MKAPWKIIHLELSQPLETLILPEGYQGILAIFCWRGIPLGDLEITAAELPIASSNLSNLAVRAISQAVGGQLLAPAFSGALPLNKSSLQSVAIPDFSTLINLKSPLKQLENKLLSQQTNNISVIICTRNRPKQLHQCLSSLIKLQSLPQEILVVDNAPSSSATKEVVNKFPQVRYILEPCPGLSIARNTGISLAKGAIIAFTDDDVEVHPNWLNGIQNAFKNEKTMAVTGLMLPAELATEAQVNFHLKSGSRWEYQPLIFDSQFFQAMQPVGVPVWRVGAGANMAFRSKIFDLVGNFNEILGAGASGCSEDSEIWYRILAEGWQCRYEPTAVVFHHHRSDLASLQKQMYQYMRGHIVALLVQFTRYRHWGNLKRIVIELPMYYGKRWLKKVIKNNNSSATLGAEIKGCFAGVKYFWQHKNNFVGENK